MFKKLFISFCLIALFLLSSNVFAEPISIPTPTPNKEEYDFASMTTYEMFWPITAGKVPGDKFYNIKVWRDKLEGYLFFGPVKKSEYLKQLANKRLLEAEKLLDIQRYSFFPKTLEESTGQIEEGLRVLFSAEQTSQTLWLENEYAKDLQKHLIVLERMKGKIEAEEVRKVLEESLINIRELIDKYKLSNSL